jgi:4-amino-4-deoxy-L-arabinose transferase-like glycosyltransferase
MARSCKSDDTRPTAHPDSQAVNKKQRSLPADLFSLGAVLAWVVGYSYPYFFESLSHNIRQIQTYNLDSTVMLHAVEDAMASAWFRMQFIEYGHFYFNLTMATAWLYQRIFPLSEWGLFFILRFYSLIGGCCTIVITFFFARRFLGRLEAIFAAIVLGFSPRFIEFSNEVKPDSWQIFFMTLSLYWLARAFEAPARQDAKLAASLNANFGFVLAASAAAGAAFGTKYQGILLVPLLLFGAWMVPAGAIGERFFARATRPFVVIAVLAGLGLAWLGRVAYPLNVMLFLQGGNGDGVAPARLYWEIQGARVGCYLAGLLSLAGAAAYVLGFDFAPLRKPLARPVIFLCTGLSFLAAFALSSPWLLYHLQFVPNLYQRSDIVSAGAWYGFRWLAMIFGIGPDHPTYFLAHALGVLSVLGSLWLLIAAARRGIAVYLPFLFLLAFTVIFVGLLVIKVNFVTSLYPLPVMPPMILLAAFGLHQIRAVLPRWLEPRKAAAGAMALAGLLILDQIWDGGGQLIQYPLLVTTMSPANRKLGDWMERCVPANAKILSAAYSYVPLKIASVAINWGPDMRYLVSEAPDLVTINLDDAASAAKDRAAGQAAPESGRDRFYDAVLKSGAWRPGPSFAPFQVFTKTSRPVVSPACQ